MKRGGPLRRTRMKTKRRDSIPADVRQAVYTRSEGYCEACGLWGANHVHHRKLRSQGGRHELANLLHVHGTCHERIHANRDGQSYLVGLLVRSTDDPAEIPVIGWRWAA